jgi:hypothetical protein
MEEGRTVKPKFNGVSLIGAVMMLAVGISVCSADQITYQIDQTGIGFDNGSVTGTIETDGTTGTLAASDIISWNLQAVCLGFLGCSASNFTLTGGVGGNSTVSTTGNGLLATTIQILFNYASGGVFEIADGSDAWALGLTDSGGNVYEEILPVGLNGNALPETGTHVIGTEVADVPEPSTYVLTLMGALVLLRKRLVSASR